MLSLCFPSICAHCLLLHTKHTRFCQHCNSLLTFINLRNRCPMCLTKRQKHTRCHKCYKTPTPYRRQGAVFENIGPMRILYKQAEQDPKTIAALFAWQFLRLQWPTPDYIIASQKEYRIAKYTAKLLSYPWKKTKHKLIGKHILFLTCQHDEIPEQLYLGNSISKLHFVL